MTQPFSKQREAIVESGVGMLGRAADFAIKVLDFVNLKNSRSAYKNKIADETESQMIDLLLNPASLDEVVEGLQVVRLMFMLPHKVLLEPQVVQVKVALEI
jgi:hypothetical protein